MYLGASDLGHRYGVLRSVLVDSFIECCKSQGGLPDEGGVHNSGDYANSDSLLLRSLTAGGSAPTQNERVNTVCADGENDHGDIATGSTDVGASKTESKGGDTLGDGDMPRALVELARRPGDSDGDGTGNEVGWASQHKRDGLVEAKSLDHSREEVLETICGKMHVGHGSEDPHHGVLGSLSEASPDRGFATVADSVHSHAVGGEFTLVWCEPLGVVWEVGKEEEANNSNDKGNHTLEDEEPAPASDASNIAKTVEDARGDETGESSSEDVASVEDSNAGGDLLTGVEHGEEVDSAGVVWGLSHAKEEAGEQETSEVLGQGGKSRNDGPQHHAAAHVSGRSGAVEEHVGGNLAEEVTDEENRHTRLILCAGEVQVLFQVVQTCQCNGVTVKVILIRLA